MLGVIHSKLATLLLTTAFLPGVPAPEGHLPAIPSLSPSEFENLEPSIRGQIQKGYERVQTHPQDEEACGRLAMILQANQLYDLALVFYQRAQVLGSTSKASLESGSGPAGAWKWAYYAGALQSSLGKKDKALAPLRDAVALNPDYLPAQVQLAEALLETGQWDKSEKIYTQVLQRDSKSSLAHHGLGRIHSARGELSAAAENYRQASQLFPGFAAAHYSLAMVYRDLGDTVKSEEQLSLFQRFEGGKPTLEDPLMKSIADLKSGPSHHVREGVRLQSEQKLEQALAQFTRALELEPQSAEAHAGLLSTYLDQAQIHIELTKFELSKAEEHYRDALRIDPDVYEIHYNYGVLLKLQGRQEEAIEAFERALQINPFHPDSHNNLGFLYAEQGRLTDAEKRFHSAIENNPNYRFAHFGLARILRSRGENREAIERLLKTLSVEDENTPTFMYHLAGAYASVGDFQKALHYAQEARQRATSFGQTPMVADLDRLLEKLRQAGNLR